MTFNVSKFCNCIQKMTERHDGTPQDETRNNRLLVDDESSEEETDPVLKVTGGRKMRDNTWFSTGNSCSVSWRQSTIKPHS